MASSCCRSRSHARSPAMAAAPAQAAPPSTTTATRSPMPSTCMAARSPMPKPPSSQVAGGCRDNSWTLTPLRMPRRSWDGGQQHSSPEKKCLHTTPAGPPRSRHVWVPFEGKLLSMTVTCDAAVAVSFLQEIRGTPPKRHMIVGLDTEWKMLDGNGFMMALLQLCVGTSVLVFQVLYGVSLSSRSFMASAATSPKS